MIAGAQDGTYASPGAIWSLMPRDIRVSPAIANDPGIETHFLGGRAVAVHLLAAESTCLIVAGWSHLLEGTWPRRTVTAARAIHRKDGTPDEMSLQRLSDASQDTDAVATWPISNTQFIVMVHKQPSDTYELWFLDGDTQLGVANVTTLAVPPGLVLPDASAVRICFAAVASVAFIVSTAGSKLRFSTFPLLGPSGAHDLTLSPAVGRLSGLTGLTVSSLRFAGNDFSMALTAERNVPGLGGVSQGVILRLLSNGTPDPAYGEDGL
jgi:hypothetical protein